MSDQTTQNFKFTLSLPETCQALGIGETLLRKLIRDKQIQPIKLGRRTVFTPASITACLEKIQQSSTTHV